MTPWLTPDEMHELTGKQRWAAQARALAGLGVPYRLNAQGRPLVERWRVLSKPPEQRQVQSPRPRWDRMKGAA